MFTIYRLDLPIDKKTEIESYRSFEKAFKVCSYLNDCAAEDNLDDYIRYFVQQK